MTDNREQNETRCGLHRWRCSASEGKECKFKGGNDERHWCLDCGVRRDRAAAPVSAPGEAAQAALVEVWRWIQDSQPSIPDGIRRISASTFRAIETLVDSTRESAAAPSPGEALPEEHVDGNCPVCRARDLASLRAPSPGGDALDVIVAAIREVTVWSEPTTHAWATGILAALREAGWTVSRDALDAREREVVVGALDNFIQYVKREHLDPDYATVATSARAKITAPSATPSEGAQQ